MLCVSVIRRNVRSFAFRSGKGKTDPRALGQGILNPKGSLQYMDNTRTDKKP